METLNLYPVAEVAEALNEIMLHPPKDHEGNEYRGRPGLVDVTRTIQIARENRAIEAQRKRGDLTLKEMRELQERADKGEKFYGLADLAKETVNLGSVKQMPTAKEIFPDIDPDRNKAKLEKQREELLKGGGQ